MIDWNEPITYKVGRPANRRDLAAGILMMLGRVTAARLAEEASWPHYQASQALKSLLAKGRARRQEVVTPEGRYFVYEVCNE